MASHRRPKQPSRARVTVLTAAAAAAVALTSQAAYAAPSEKPSKDEVKAKVDKLYEEAEQATEKFNGAKEKQEKLEKEIGTIQDKVARGQDELNELRDSLGLDGRAPSTAPAASTPPSQLFLSADPDDYLDKASTLDQLSGQQVEALEKIQAKQRDPRAAAPGGLRQARGPRGHPQRARQEEEGSPGQARRGAEAPQHADGRREGAPSPPRTPAPAAAPASASDLGDVQPPARARAASAYAAAQTKIGTPYVYGASGPNSFDCSGLTSWAYAQAGVSIPRTSQAQANAGTRIYSQSELQLGDLVIFYGDLHHVGLYAGNGQVLHAPRSGTVVRYESIDNMPFQFGVRI